MRQRAGDAARPAAAVLADAVGPDRRSWRWWPGRRSCVVSLDDRRPWDPGLQNERTGLAWQRTMLSGLTCSVLVARVLARCRSRWPSRSGRSGSAGHAALGWLALRRFRGNATRRCMPSDQSATAEPTLLITGLVTLLTALERCSMSWPICRLSCALAVAQFVQPVVVDAEVVGDLVHDGDPHLLDHLVSCRRSPGSVSGRSDVVGQTRCRTRPRSVRGCPSRGPAGRDVGRRVVLDQDHAVVDQRRELGRDVSSASETSALELVHRELYRHAQRSGGFGPPPSSLVGASVPTAPDVRSEAGDCTGSRWSTSQTSSRRPRSIR